MWIKSRRRRWEGADGVCRQLMLHVVLLFFHFVPVPHPILSDSYPLYMSAEFLLPVSSTHPHCFFLTSSHLHCSLPSFLTLTRRTVSVSSLPRSTTTTTPSLNWESGRAVEIALTRALPGCAIHLLFYYAAPGLLGRCRSICHRPRSLITGICHRLASLLMLSSPPWQPPSAGERRRQSTSVKRIFPRLRGPHTAISHIKALMKGAGRVCTCVRLCASLRTGAIVRSRLCAACAYTSTHTRAQERALLSVP